MEPVIIARNQRMEEEEAHRRRRRERRQQKIAEMTPEELETKRRVRRMRRANRRGAEMEAYRREDGLEEAREAQRQLQMGMVVRPRVEAPPAPKMTEFLSSELIGMAEQLGLQWDCPICMDSKVPREFVLSPCGHRMCGGCCESIQTSTLRRECPQCRA